MNVVFAVAYITAIIGVSLYVLSLITRFVKAHERAAAALSRIADAQKRSNSLP